MKFTELTIHTSTFGSELVADILWNYTNYGVAICDVNDVIELQKDKHSYWDYIDDDVLEQSTDVLVKGFITKEISKQTIKDIENDLILLKERTKDANKLGSLETVKREIEGDDWIGIWKKHFRPIKINNIIICPEWIAYDKKESEQVIKLDSNMAFGTGEHETTSMCIELLQEYVSKDSVVIDVGCGSGILGITAIKLGAKEAILTDIDFVAVKSATHNAELNSVIDKCKIDLSNLLDDTSIKGDLMVANITADVLCMLAEGMNKNLKENGKIILSGIIDSKIDMVKKTYLEKGYKVEKQIKKGEWYALALQKV